MKHDIPWFRVFVEGGVVVASILLAFGIDAWWEEFGKRSDARDALLGLQVDFGQFQRSLMRVDSVAESELAAAEYLLSLGGAPGSEISASKADSALRRVINAETFDPGQRTLDALTSSGRLQLIMNGELRNILASWDSRVDEIRDDQLVVRDFVRTSLVPYLAREGVPLTRVYHSFYPDRPADSVHHDAAAAVYARLVRDSEFRSLLSYRHNWTLGVKSEVDRGLQRITQILTLLETELAR